MKSMLIILLLLISISFEASGQCNYAQLMEEGEALFKKEFYQKALDKFNAARTCNQNESEAVDQQIQKVFLAIEQKKIEAEKNFEKARKNAIAARLNEALALEAEYRTQQSLKTADSLRQIADEKQREEAKQRYRTEALNYAYQSLIENNPDMKRYRALQAYYLNRQYNGGRWQSTILNALIQTDYEKYAETWFQFNTPILGLLKVDQYFFIVCGNNIYRMEEPFDSLDIKGFLTPPFYLRNSLKYYPSDSCFSLRDQYNREYRFNLNLIPLNTTESKKGVEHLYKNSQIIVEGNLISFVPKETNNATTLKLPISQTVTASEISPDQKRLCLGTQDGKIYIYNIENKVPLKEADLQFHSPGTYISAVAFDPTSNYLATTGFDGYLKLISLESLKEQKPFEIKHEEWLNDLIFKDRDHLIVGTQSGYLIEYNISLFDLAEIVCNKIWMPNVVRGKTEADKQVKRNCK